MYTLVLSVQWWNVVPYIVGKFGKSSLIRQSKTIQILFIINILMAESIHLPNFISPTTGNLPNIKGHLQWKNDFT